mmetsp:Transcript_45961/g.55745  ORF Transcript_45961/g.55745 Transcript_45961/m.55745 type:complete len:159 (-) Transcript_45961:24-500(-)
MDASANSLPQRFVRHSQKSISRSYNLSSIRKKIILSTSSLPNMTFPSYTCPPIFPLSPPLTLTVLQLSKLLPLNHISSIPLLLTTFNHTSSHRLLPSYLITYTQTPSSLRPLIHPQFISSPPSTKIPTKIPQHQKILFLFLFCFPNIKKFTSKCSLHF